MTHTFLPNQLKSKCLLILLLFVVTAGYGFQSDDPLLKKMAQFKDLLEKNQVEKIHIHTNQPFYNTPDTIWFKSYIVNSFYNRPSAASKILNVDLLNSSGAVVYRTKLKSEAGLAWGNIPVTDSIMPGMYYLRAYTPGMKNFGQAFYYERSIRIKNNTEKAAVISAAAANSIQFFPEGGDLVSGIRSKVAFKSIAKNGFGIDASGSIVDDAGELIAEFNSEHLGMGVFAFTPQPGKTYTARVKFKDGSELQEKIPAAKSQGYTISVTGLADSVRVRVGVSPGLKETGILTLIASQDGISKYVSQFSVNNQAQNTVWISKDLLSSGTAQFTLFDPEKNPVSERLIFVNKYEELLILADIKPKFNKREAVNFVLYMKNKAGQPEIGNLSVSVYNESELSGNDNDEVSIFSDLLLSSDLKGFIESPNYYFNDFKDENRARHLDHLLLTQGWRKFSWKNVLSKRFPEIKENREEGIELSGKMTLPSGKPFALGEVTLFKGGFPSTILQSKTDENGYFKFPDMNVTDTARFVISSISAGFRKNMKIELFNQEDQKAVLNNFTSFKIAGQEKSLPENARLNELQYRNNGILLNAVSVTAKKIPKVLISANLNGAGRADAVLTAADLLNQHDLSVFLSNRVNGLKLANGKIYNRDTPESGMFEGPQPMLVILDGISLTQEYFDLSSVNADGIQSVEVLKGAATTGLYGIEGSYGVLVITSKTGSDRYGNTLNARTPGMLPVTVIGYQRNREFYSPRYDLQNAPTSGNADLRKAVYWNPNVSVGIKDQTEIKYFNSDYIGTHKIVIEGINADGQIGRFVFRYEVK
ncbi:TonB-dependent receptor [Daejeonella oryzae]|uniref:TonB-dependent receptor n=1 Tax=Daejeonella oryzae TaxID=1122943 RepID=UPI000478C747|nr:Plug domain-containing protein [Daejeonella oryzae]